MALYGVVVDQSLALGFLVGVNGGALVEAVSEVGGLDVVLLVGGAATCDGGWKCGGRSGLLATWVGPARRTGGRK